jgi:hypothetical protein
MGARVGLIAAVLGITVFSGTSRAQDFEVANEYQLPAIGRAWATADFDADGDADIAAVTLDGLIVTAFNDGDGGFTVAPSPTSLPLGLDDNHAHAGDFDGDGVADLLVTSSFGSFNDGPPCSATLFLNLGNGTFGPGENWAAVVDVPDTYVTSCTALDVGDFDADGSLDFVLAISALSYSTLDGYLNVFRGNGNGTFMSPTLTALSEGQPYISLAMVSGDFDGDGTLDLAMGQDVTYLSGSMTHRVQILSGDGTGQFFPTFTQSLLDSAFTSFTGARAQDLNGDGWLDLTLLVSSSITGGAEPRAHPVLALENAGDGTLSGPITVAEEIGVVAVEAVDFDDDGSSELVVVSFEDRVTVARADSQGAYATDARFAIGGAPSASLSADFDGDGRDDLAVLNARRPVFHVALAQPTGLAYPLPRATRLRGLGDGVYVAPGDYDGDGLMDLLTSEYGEFNVMLGTGDGRFGFGARIVSNASPVRPLVADLNDDALPDLVLPAPDAGYQTLFGSPDGTFSGVTSVDLGARDPLREAELGDFDEDGDLDLAAFGTTTLADPSRLQGNVTFYTNDGAGNFSANQVAFLLTTIAQRLLFADLNGDSHLDLFVGSSTGTLGQGDESLRPGNSLTLLGDGTGSFIERIALPAAANHFELGDVDGDGSLDLATNTGVALGNGDGTFGSLTPVSPDSRMVALVDIDQDGRLDLVSREPWSLSIFPGNGDGTFAPADPVLTFDSGMSLMPVLSVVDFTGDGELDLLAARLPSMADSFEPKPELLTFVGIPASTPEPPESCGPRPGHHGHHAHGGHHAHHGHRSHRGHRGNPHRGHHWSGR